MSRALSYDADARVITGPRTAAVSERRRGSPPSRSAGNATAAVSRNSRRVCGTTERLGILHAVEQWIVDVHSHLVPSGDDGARTVEQGLELCRRAAAHGTRVLYATPHVHASWGQDPLTPERLARYTETFPVMRAACAPFGLELRRGFELYPGALPPSADLRDFGLGTSGAVLIEFPGFWTREPDPLRAAWDEAERAERAGLIPVLAHP